MLIVSGLWSGSVVCGLWSVRWWIHKDTPSHHSQFTIHHSPLPTHYSPLRNRFARFCPRPCPHFRRSSLVHPSFILRSSFVYL